MASVDRESLANAWQTAKSPDLWKLLGVLSSVAATAFSAAAAGAHFWLAQDIAAAVQAEHEKTVAALLELAKQRMSLDDYLSQHFAWANDQIIENYRLDVRLRASIAEPDWRKRDAAANVAELAFGRALSGWPCESDPDKLNYKQNCVTPEHAARMALQTRPPR